MPEHEDLVANVLKFNGRGTIFGGLLDYFKRIVSEVSENVSSRRLPCACLFILRC